MAVSGDTGARLEDIVVGANGEDSRASGEPNDSGAAYVFVRTGTSFGQQAFLKADNAGAGDFFGRSVAVSGDTVVVGANGLKTAAQQADRTTTVWKTAGRPTSLSARAQALASKPSSRPTTQRCEATVFGTSVAVSGDTVVVGALVEDSSATGGPNDNSASSSGAAYVFVRTGTSFGQQAFLKADNAEAFDNFGTSVAVSGDTVVVGALLEDSSATGEPNDNNALASGAAYVFVRTGTSFGQQAFLKADNAEASDQLWQKRGRLRRHRRRRGYGEDSRASGGPNDNNALASGAAYVFR